MEGLTASARIACQYQVGGIARASSEENPGYLDHVFPFSFKFLFILLFLFIIFCPFSVSFPNGFGISARSMKDLKDLPSMAGLY